MSWGSNNDFNPYAAPSASSDLYEGSDAGMQILANRSTRLGAAILDGLMMLIAMAPAAVVLVSMREEWGWGLGFIWLGFSSYQWYLLATLGQTLGKKWLGIKVVKMDGSPVNFVTGVLLRSWIMGGLGAIPYLGGCLGLIDALMIFGEERRCLHDLIAGTKVIQVLPY